MLLSNKINFFGIYFYCSDLNLENENPKFKYNILLIGNKYDNGYIMTQFITEYEDRIESINYSYNASSIKELKDILNRICCKIYNPKNKFILMCEDDIDYHKMENILEKWKNDIIIINKEKLI
jgi:hypothetical protein